MPFLRYTRDKRGYEHTYVMHAYRPGQGPSRARVLYLFRSPSNLKIGRRALEPEVTEALEHTHPDLSFDWTSLPREIEVPREVREPRSYARQARRPPSPPSPAPRPAAERAVVIEDESVLGRVLGAQEAARLRTKYSELVQRIARRARTPDDRDRLTERAARLNPDEWADESAIRAGITTFDEDVGHIAAELPHRRRGRRGGRHRLAAGPPRGGPDRLEPSGGPSAIMADEGHPHDEEDENGDDDPLAGASDAAGVGGDDRGVGPDDPGVEGA